MACLEGLHSSDSHQILRGFAEAFVNPSSSEKPSGPELLVGQNSMRKCGSTRDFQDLYLYPLGGVMPACPSCGESRLQELLGAWGEAALFPAWRATGRQSQCYSRDFQLVCRNNCDRDWAAPTVLSRRRRTYIETGRQTQSCKTECALLDVCEAPQWPAWRACTRRTATKFSGALRKRL